MQKKVVKGTTENLNILNEKVNYIGFELGKVPDFLKEFEPLKYDVPRDYDETTYKVYKYVSVDDIEILITTNNRLDDLGERYKNASPLFTYMQAENNENIEKYAYFLKMINETKIEEIKEIEEEQKGMQNKIPLEVKFENNFKWQVYYSDYANKYFMLASTEESDNSPLFYLLKKKIEQHKSRSKKENKIFIPISNEEYTEKILKRSDIEDLENYLWYFTKNWASIYEVTDKDGNLSLQIVGEAKIYDQMTSKYNLTYMDRKDAINEYKLIKALFILAYDIQNEYIFDTRINDKGCLTFFYNGEEIEYSTLPEFLKKQAIIKMEQNSKVKLETKELKADVQDLQKHSEEQNQEYLKKENQIYTFLECKKTFFGRMRYFFKNKKKSEEETKNVISKNRMKDILKNDKNEEKPYDSKADINKSYTVEDIIKVCKELNESIKENKNTKLDIAALKNKIESVDKKLKEATKYLEEIEKHKKSIFDFWKFANENKTQFLNEGTTEKKEEHSKLKKTFNYDDDIDTLATKVDKDQRENLTEREMNATYIANFVIDGINIVSKSRILKSDKEKLEQILDNLKQEYKDNIDKIEKKDFDIFGNVAEDKTKIKLLNNTEHRESERDKFKILNLNLNTTIDEFIDKLVDMKNLLKEESEKIETPYDIAIYKASNEKLDAEGFAKFDLNSQETLEALEEDEKSKEIYLYKINIPEKFNLIFYTNIMFYENINRTLPVGMDVSQETLINMNLYNLSLKDKEEFNINVCKDEYESFVKKVKVYEYNIERKQNTKENKK